MNARVRERSRIGSLLDQWWVMVVRGVLAILFAVLALAWPQITWIVLLALFAALAITEGVASLVAAVRARDWGWRFWYGVLSLAIGVVTIIWPGPASLALLIWIAAWAITRGIFDIAAAITLRKEIRYEWLLVLSGLISIAFGVFLVVWPLAGMFAVVGVVAAFAIFSGVLLISSGLRQRKVRHDRALGQPPPSPAVG
ncbi:MAG TPA: HdeD family acid-resistance protein [Steroidobacteraceae bacterium]|nr:HdeD family acid-resistance protein [Steroidobacteraceae bacterium]